MTVARQLKLQIFGAGCRKEAYEGSVGPKTILSYEIGDREGAKGRRGSVRRKASHRGAEQRGGSLRANMLPAAAACRY